MQAARSSLMPKLSANKTIGIVIWLAGAWMTAQFLRQLGVPRPFDSVFGCGIQAALTFGERPLWRGHGYPKFAVLCTIGDTLLNGAGILPYAVNLGDTDFWRLLSLAMQSSGAPALATILVFTALVGGLTAAAPEYFWSQGD
jgi:hypothetical protein